MSKLICKGWSLKATGYLYEVGAIVNLNQRLSEVRLAEA